MNLTGFPETEAYIQRHLAGARLDPRLAELRLLPCRLGECRGTCCHDGAVLGREEAHTIMALCEDEAPFLSSLGVTLQDTPVKALEDGRHGTFVTAVRPRDDMRDASEYPAHFPATACVFLMEDHRCALQVLSEARSHHPWHWKPVSCWMHPLSFDETRGQLALTVHSDETDPRASNDQPGFVAWTPCGKQRCAGEPVSKALEMELKFLGSMIERNLVAEMRSLEE